MKIELVPFWNLLKARGIAFRDEKKMNVKGSELGHSLGTIEKILQLTIAQKQVLIQRQFQKLMPSQSQYKSTYPKLSKNNELNKELGFASPLDLLLKPEYDKSATPHELLKKKEKENTAPNTYKSLLWIRKS